MRPTKGQAVSLIDSLLPIGAMRVAARQMVGNIQSSGRQRRETMTAFGRQWGKELLCAVALAQAVQVGIVKPDESVGTMEGHVRVADWVRGVLDPRGLALPEDWGTPKAL